MIQQHCGQVLNTLYTVFLHWYNYYILKLTSSCSIKCFSVYDNCVSTHWAVIVNIDYTPAHQGDGWHHLWTMGLQENHCTGELHDLREDPHHYGELAPPTVTLSHYPLPLSDYLTIHPHLTLSHPHKTCIATFRACTLWSLFQADTKGDGSYRRSSSHSHADWGWVSPGQSLPLGRQAALDDASPCQPLQQLGPWSPLRERERERERDRKEERRERGGEGGKRIFRVIWSQITNIFSHE